MFRLDLNAIHIGARASNKQEAIKLVAAALCDAGSIRKEYVNGMLAREQQTSTYIGNGIAIPHGTTETRHEVLKTGIQIFQFSEGVKWGDNQTVYIVIGIAAKADDHLELLKQLTHILSDDCVEAKLRNTDSAEVLHALLTGERKITELKFNTSLIVTNVAASNLLTLQLLNVCRLLKIGAVDKHFVSNAANEKALHLGRGIWLDSSERGNLQSAVAISRLAIPQEEEGEPLVMLITVSMADNQPQKVLSHLSQLLIREQEQRLLEADKAGILALLTTEAVVEAPTLTAEYVIRNEHGLHARPGIILVSVIKQFNSTITITNLDGTGIPSNGRSLMKVVALGVKRGHRLRVTATGNDAEAALSAIEETISNGIGESVV